MLVHALTCSVYSMALRAVTMMHNVWFLWYWPCMRQVRDSHLTGRVEVGSASIKLSCLPAEGGRVSMWVPLQVRSILVAIVLA